MAVRAVVFDLGDVLERVGDDTWLEHWRVRLGLDRAAFDAAVAGVDPDQLDAIGALDEAELRERWAQALGLTAQQAGEFWADQWDWYCGTPDLELFAFAERLRPEVRTAVLSNSADGARREEQERYDLAARFDPVLYSHELGVAKPDPKIYAITCERLDLPPEEIAFLDDVEANVAAARAFGSKAVLHRDTPSSIAALDQVLGRS